MELGGVSARAGSPRCSPIALRWACSALLVAALAACGGAALVPSGARVLAHLEVTNTQMSSHDGAAAVSVGLSDTARAAILAQVPTAVATPDRVFVAAFQGGQRTGGYAIRIDRIELDGDRLLVHATFGVPPPGSIVTQVLTSPAHVVSVARRDVIGVRTAILLDASGTERARASVS
jgi:hypothetical protein